MRSLLWTVLALAAAVNTSSAFVLDGVAQAVVGIGTGLLALASATFLVLTREQRP